MNNKEAFIEIFKKNITRDGAERLLEWLTSSDFFTAPASTRFHGAYEGGLLEHSLNVYRCLKWQIEKLELGEAYSPETVALVALLHDVCKVNFYKVGYRNVKDDKTGLWSKKEVYEIDEKFPCGHGEKSVIILQNFMKLSVDEIYAIRAHMGGFDTSVRGGDRFIGKIIEQCKLALLLHFADMYATNVLEVEPAQ